MNKNILNLNQSISGNYIVSIVKNNGNEYFPFGKKQNKNLILDTFFNSILRDNYRFSAQAFIQSCRVGGGTNSDLSPERTQTGLQGLEIYISHNGNVFTANVSGSSLVLSRDFIFPVNSTLNPIVCREATVGCFGSNITGMDITVSRFVFPADIIINNGEQLKITYTLNINLPYLTSNMPVTLSSNDLNLSGIIRLTSNLIGIRSSDPSTNDVSNLEGVSTPATVIIGNASATYYHRNWKTETTSQFSNNVTNNSFYGSYNSIFSRQSLTGGGEQVGFFDQSHVASLTTYPTSRPTYTLSGPVGSFQSLNYLINNDSASIDLDYYLPAHISNRNTGGIYLWYQTNSYSYTATYLKFTENNFTTNRSLIIPAGQPVGFKIRWSFTR